MVDFIREHREEFGVEPICTVLSKHGCKIAPSPFYDHLSRRPSKRALRDADIVAVMTQARQDQKLVKRFGARRMWLHLRSAGHDVARCTIERLMAAQGWAGATRIKKYRTTVPDPGAARASDLVERDFTATAPNQLWVADFTYVATFSGTVYVAFVFDVFSRMILGWRAATSMRTDLVLDTLEMAIWNRGRQGISDLTGLVHHNDAGSQGGFNWWSQHLDHGGVRWEAMRSRCRRRPRVRGGSGRRIGRCVRRCVHRDGRSRLVRCSGSSGD